MGSAGSHVHTLTVVVLALHLLSSQAVTVEVLAKAGDSVELPCSRDDASFTSPHVVEWIQQGLDVPVLIKFGSYAPRVHPRYEGRASLVQSSSLRLSGVQLEDRGLYECRTLLLDKPTDELRNGSWTLLSITAPPTFTQAPPLQMEALFGASLSLTCVASGNPAPIITWLKDGREIPGSNDKVEVLVLPAVTSQSAGLYVCIASNSEGNVSHTTNVKVKGPPVIIVPPRNTAINISQNALLQCQAVADPPNMTYVWLKDGENVHHTEALKSRVRIMVDGTLLITRITPEDSGNYTCVPTNGLLTPPNASANLTVMHPAQALQMPEETYLPTGMEGGVACPVAANPPLLRVDWTKDGRALDLSLFPGWTLRPGGFLFMATVNDDAAGVYTCTPYNSYGSMGPSGPTHVILQEAPSFSIAPHKHYQQWVGRSLSIACQGRTQSSVKVSWSKVDPGLLVSYFVEPNGSLLLQPLLKEHQGTWRCGVSNRVATVTADTQVDVLGTSPHSSSILSVSPGVNQANVSWQPGFDGGSAQTFSLWVKKISGSDGDGGDDGGDDGGGGGKQDWFSMLVPSSSGTTFQVEGLTPATRYQFSVLTQNRIGTGPFSDIVTSRTLDPPLRPRPPQPPQTLRATRGSAGVILHWSHPRAQQQAPISAFVLQSRTDQGAWLNVDYNISANATEMMVPGLNKDCVYELRLLSRVGEMLSERGPSVNVSTVGMEVYPSTSQLQDSVPEPLLAGVLSGVGFMLLALVLLVGVACFISHGRKRRRRRRGERKEEEPHTFICKCSPSMETAGTISPDSMLKKSLLPGPSLSPSSYACSSACSSSSFSSENPYRQRQLPLRGRGSHAEETSALVSPHKHSISRGADGRFALPLSDDCTHSLRSVRSSEQSGEDERTLPFVVSVDLPPYQLNAQQYASCSGPKGFSDLSSTLPRYHREATPTPTFPVLPHLRGALGRPSTTVSTLVLQMEEERERKNLSRCLQLAQEREELERQLHRYSLGRESLRSHTLPRGHAPQTTPPPDEGSTLPRRPLKRHKQEEAAERKNHGRPRPHTPDTDTCLEMSVDEPGEVLLVRDRGSPDRRRRTWTSRVTDPLQPVDHWRPLVWESKRRSQSLDLRRQRRGLFLTPDAWIHSLSQENFSWWRPPSSADPAPGTSPGISPEGPTPQEVPGSSVPVRNQARSGPQESASSYSSYASSGRGSMEPTNHGLSPSRLSPALRGSADPQGGPHMEMKQRRKTSVDENYEWDSTDISTHTGEKDGLFSLRCSRPSMHCSSQALKTSQRSFSDEPQLDTVLF
ncbi:protein turtle homolog A-like isoform X2 [Gouania willdenowi]|uniref:protein turtle homolog A-like isoform X2 n=1 Tax=Gouania willdenowi TaxID=441366 RepID=UPI00105491BF|nr:protein turtle homolog A-like isoform X2 [Gouania willdenowi]